MNLNILNPNFLSEPGMNGEKTAVSFQHGVHFYNYKECMRNLINIGCQGLPGTICNTFYLDSLYWSTVGGGFFRKK